MVTKDDAAKTSLKDHRRLSAATPYPISVPETSSAPQAKMPQ